MIKRSKFEYKLKAIVFFASVIGIGINLCLSAANSIFLLATAIFSIIMGVSLFLFVNDDNFGNKPRGYVYRDTPSRSNHKTGCYFDKASEKCKNFHTYDCEQCHNCAYFYDTDRRVK